MQRSFALGRQCSESDPDLDTLRKLGLGAWEQSLCGGVVPTMIIVASAAGGSIAGGFLSEAGKEAWRALQSWISRKWRARADSLASEGRKTDPQLAVYVVGSSGDVPILYCSKGPINDDARDSLPAAEEDVKRLCELGIATPKRFLGINLEELPMGPYLRFFGHLPSVLTLWGEIQTDWRTASRATHTEIAERLESMNEATLSLKHRNLANGSGAGGPNPQIAGPNPAWN